MEKGKYPQELVANQIGIPVLRIRARINAHPYTISHTNF
jgi:hypothetical protein